MRTSAYALLILVLWLVACGHAGDDGEASAEAALDAAPSAIVLQLDPSLPPTVRDRIEALVRGAASGVAVTKAAPETDRFADGAHVLAIGDVAGARSLVSDAEATAVPAEGFVLRSGERNGARVLASRARTKDRGQLYGAYAALEAVGFGFLHPLAPSSPSRFAVPAPGLDRHESPRWHVRGIHLHTMHPIELANVLNGWGKTSPQDAAGFEAMLPEWDRFLEWMIANRQNRVEWSLLEAKSWEAFSESDERLARLTKLVQHAHTWGVEAGADTPIALQQQHAFRLVTKQGELADELASIRRRIDWLMRAGFDSLSTENGTTEFTHADPQRMLAWMNEVAKTEKPTSIKIHCSSGQTADGFTDPATGGPLNVNMLPHYADKRLGVLPHTVQHYGLDDKAPTYGNKDFDYMRKFLQQEVGKREVVWHPESAYWVSFDIDVPLFLPIYAERRVHDLRLIASDEAHGLMAAPGHMDGQMLFSSGWEWGYWLNDLVAARAAWNPHTDAATDDAATRAILDDALGALGPAKKATIDALLGWMHDQKDLLIDGKVDGKVPNDIVMRNGQAYLQGWETWDDVSLLAGKIPGVSPPKTQPDHLGLVEMRSPVHGGPGYSKEIAPLLTATERAFDARAAQLTQALSGAPADIASELGDSARITALRAKQVHGLYDYVDSYWETYNPFSDAAARRKERLKTARAALDDAARIVASRETKYRVPVSRIAGWGNNPTAYEYGYLWTVHSLHYWWRDEGKAVDVPKSPCYLNTVNPADVALGEGKAVDAVRLARRVFDDTPLLGSIAECLAEPASEPHYPQDGLRSRP